MTDTGAKKMTWLFMLIAFAIIVGYDIAAYQWFPKATISALTGGFAAKYQGAAMAVCLAIGYLLGHLFWPQKK